MRIFAAVLFTRSSSSLKFPQRFLVFGVRSGAGMRVAGRAGFGRRAGLLRQLGLRGRLRRARRIGAGAGMLALAVPLAWPSGAGGQHLSVPSAGPVRSGLVRLADFVTGDGPSALVVPEQQSGTGSLKPHIVSASASRNVKH